MKHTITVAFIAAWALIGTSCNTSDDITDDQKPRVTTFELITPDAQIGDSIEFTFTVSDNDVLSEARADIHDNFDGHRHQKVEHHFSWEKIYQLTEQKEVVISEKLFLDTGSLGGPYDLQIIALDRTGNESEVFIRSMLILSPDGPTLDVSLPADLEVFSLTDTVEIQYIATDESNVAKVEVTVEKEIGQDQEVLVFDRDFELQSERVETRIPLLQSRDLDGVGKYEVAIKVWDQEGNMNIAYRDFYVE